MPEFTGGYTGFAFKKFTKRLRMLKVKLVGNFADR